MYAHQMLLIVGFNYDAFLLRFGVIRVLCYTLLASFSDKLQSVQNIDNPVCHAVIWALLMLAGTEYCTNYIYNTS